MVYRDALGRPTAEANISVVGGAIGDAIYCLKSVIHGYPAHRWSIDTPIEDIVRDMEAEGFVCTVGKDGYNKPKIKCIHTETQAIIDAKKAEQAKKFSGAVRGYVRFGDLPKGGKSRNHRDDVLENGVSCFHAEFAPDGAYRLLLTPVLEVSYLTVAARQAYRLYGEVVGTGADGEPLLRVERAEKI